MNANTINIYKVIDKGNRNYGKTYTFKTAQGAQHKYDSLTDHADMYQETDVVNYDVKLASK